MRKQPNGAHFLQAGYSVTPAAAAPSPAQEHITRYELLSFPTGPAPDFVDLTETIENLVHLSQIEFGIANVQTRHTTTGLLINENEPLLMEDFKRRLDELAHPEAPYRHDQLALRTGIPLHERKNGHAHCKALHLRSSETVNIAHGNLDLGTWQRILLVELDLASTRTVSLVLMGARSRASANRA